MAELVAQGANPNDRWRRTLIPGRTAILGRTAGEWGIPWDKWASRAHAEIEWDGVRLRVRRVATAGNPLYFRGEETDGFDARNGDCFTIGLTVFTVQSEVAGTVTETHPLVQQRAVHPDELKNVPFRDAPHRLDVLRKLPGVIVSATADPELYAQLVNLLLAGIPRADLIGLVSHDRGEVVVLYAESRRFQSQEFRPSQRLVQEAVGRQQKTIVHVWAAAGMDADPSCSGRTFTMMANLDWAFCTPIRGESTGLGIYVAGRMSSDEAATVAAPLTESDLVDDLKFAELTADIFAALRQVRRLQRDQARLSQFFSPAVQKLLTAAEPEQALRPRVTEVAVLFCDLRGFSHTVEAGAEQLLPVLERVSQALGVMTQNILDQQGVVADFLGDAALGFWGWPLPDEGMVGCACRAALGIRKYYREQATRPGHPLAGFRVGIGVATGRAVAGRIGPHEQAKVTVFGPVVNLASRLETMTKQLRVPILLDEATARFAREQLGPAVARVRRLVRVRPHGLDTPLMVSELLPPFDQDPTLNAADLENYEAALDAFLAGDWSVAFERLHAVSPNDLGKDILTGFIIAHNRTPPPGWDGVIPLTAK